MDAMIDQIESEPHAPPRDAEEVEEEEPEAIPTAKTPYRVPRRVPQGAGWNTSTAASSLRAQPLSIEALESNINLLEAAAAKPRLKHSVSLRRVPTMGYKEQARAVRLPSPKEEREMRLRKTGGRGPAVRPLGRTSASESTLRTGVGRTGARPSSSPAGMRKRPGTDEIDVLNLYDDGAANGAPPEEAWEADLVMLLTAEGSLLSPSRRQKKSRRRERGGRPATSGGRRVPEHVPHTTMHVPEGARAWNEAPRHGQHARAVSRKSGSALPFNPHEPETVSLEPLGGTDASLSGDRSRPVIDPHFGTPSYARRARQPPTRTGEAQAAFEPLRMAKPDMWNSSTRMDARFRPTPLSHDTYTRRLGTAAFGARVRAPQPSTNHSKLLWSRFVSGR